MTAPESETPNGENPNENEIWRPSIWDVLLGHWGYGYWGAAGWGGPVGLQATWGIFEPTPPSLVEPHGRWLLDEDDFSAEHGYEPDFEGRSEFEHGEFERWL